MAAFGFLSVVLFQVWHGTFSSSDKLHEHVRKFSCSVAQKKGVFFS